MRKVLAILVLAGLLVLVFSVPALAGASDPPNAWGQHRADANAEVHSWGENWGHDTLPYVKEAGIEGLGLKNWGECVAWLKDNKPWE